MAEYAAALSVTTSTSVDYVGLSLDGPTAELYDGFRGKPGNFRRVLDLLFLPAGSRQAVPDIGGLLAPRHNLASWHLLEFSPVGLGYREARKPASQEDARG